jgi:SAM-dependent methyltransferase
MSEQEDALRTVQALVDETLATRRPALALEAGCGSASNLRLPCARLIGIDISERQLEGNTLVQERILGDVQTYPLAEGRFDAVVCWDVLEHVPRPDLAICNLARATREDGILVLAFSNVASVKALVAKLTPYAVHRWVYGFVYGRKVGAAGYEPFPTYLRWSLAPDAVKRFAAERGLAVEWFHAYESGFQRKMREKLRLVGPVWRIVREAVRLLSFGIVRAEATDCLIVLRKRCSTGLGAEQAPQATFPA